jgi:hypothetical protein
MVVAVRVLRSPAPVMVEDGAGGAEQIEPRGAYSEA